MNDLRKHRAGLAPALLLLAAMGLGGCGGDEPAPAASTTPAGAAPTPAQPAATAPAVPAAPQSSDQASSSESVVGVPFVP